MAKKEMPELTRDEKARLVLISQGKSALFFDSLSDEDKEQIAAIHGSGRIAAQFQSWLNEYRDKRKATVED